MPESGIPLDPGWPWIAALALTMGPGDDDDDDDDPNSGGSGGNIDPDDDEGYDDEDDDNDDEEPLQVSEAAVVLVDGIYSPGGARLQVVD